jgi:hypothetical protein
LRTLRFRTKNRAEHEHDHHAGEGRLTAVKRDQTPLVHIGAERGGVAVDIGQSEIAALILQS